MKTQFRSAIKYLFLKGLSGKEIFGDVIESLGDQSPSYATIKNWIAEYERSDVKDEHRMILENRRIGIKNIAEALHISYERIGYEESFVQNGFQDAGTLIRSAFD